MKAIVSIGISASGKTTDAEKWRAESPGDRAIVCRDDIRWQILKERAIETSGGLWANWKFKSADEAEVTRRCIETLIRLASEGKDVYCADTNLNKKNRAPLLNRLKALGYEVEVREFPISLEEAWWRDEKRADSVGRDVIYKQYQQWKEYKGHDHYHNSVSLPAVVLVDVDGTLAHMNGKRGPFEWHNVHVDDCDDAVAHMVQMYASSGVRIVIMSGRDAICRAKTEQWLRDHSIPFDELHMRSADDMRSDVIVKRELFDNHVRGKYHVWAVIDDRPKVCRMWRELGLKVFQVGDPHHEF